MSESTQAVMIEDDEVRQDRWLSAMARVHAAVVGGLLFDDGASPEALALAMELSEALAEAVAEADEFTNQPTTTENANG
jgi:hypothetical protein